MSEKLQKVLARAGLGSRREIETWIQARRVSVNGSIVELGTRVEASDIIRVDGKIIQCAPNPLVHHRTIIYNKPEGEICTLADPKKRATVFDHLPTLRNKRWVSVGRLDFNTMGLLLFTTDGELAHRLMHPSYELERVYAVRVLGEVNETVLNRMRKGVKLDDGLARFDKIVDAGGEGANHWYHVTLKEGRYREVRRLWESQNIKVSRLIRLRYGVMTLPRQLSRGRWLELSDAECQKLYQSVGLRSSSTQVDKDKLKRSIARSRRLKARSFNPRRRADKPSTKE